MKFYLLTNICIETTVYKKITLIKVGISTCESVHHIKFIMTCKSTVKKLSNRYTIIII